MMATKRKMDGMGRMGADSMEIEFTLPEGVALDGQKGEAVIAWERTEDGTIRVTAIDGQTVSEGMEEAEGEGSPEDTIDTMGNQTEET